MTVHTLLCTRHWQAQCRHVCAVFIARIIMLACLQAHFHELVQQRMTVSERYVKVSQQKASCVHPGPAVPCLTASSLASCLQAHVHNFCHSPRYVEHVAVTECVYRTHGLFCQQARSIVCWLLSSTAAVLPVP